MTDAELIASLTDDEALGLTLYGEARGERVEGKIAIACVVRNRINAKRYGKDAKAVCLAPWQFSCWKPGGGPENYETVIDAVRNRKRGTEGPILRECMWIAEGVLDNRVRDTVRGSTHYMTRALWESKPPKWAIGRTPVIGIGSHVFFADVDA
jgi:N-acetylmuramoyl-L-alanine amidase